MLGVDGPLYLTNLISFVLKGARVREGPSLRTITEGTIFSQFQHAYIKGKSTEIALYEVITTVERSLYYRQHTLATFLDIDEAFNKVSTKAIK